MKSAMTHTRLSCFSSFTFPPIGINAFLVPLKWTGCYTSVKLHQTHLSVLSLTHLFFSFASKRSQYLFLFSDISIPCRSSNNKTTVHELLGILLFHTSHIFFHLKRHCAISHRDNQEDLAIWKHAKTLNIVLGGLFYPMFINRSPIFLFHKQA